MNKRRNSAIVHGEGRRRIAHVGRDHLEQRETACRRCLQSKTWVNDGVCPKRAVKKLVRDKAVPFLGLGVGDVRDKLE